MNIYDTKIVKCVVCGKCVGEVNFDAEISFAKCGQCTEKYDADRLQQQKTRMFLAIC